MSDIMKYLMDAYHASRADDTQCSAFLEPDKELLFGLSLNDPGANFRLLTPEDLASLGESAGAACLKSLRSPFTDMLLIFYRTENGKVSYKLINGIGSRLFEDLEDVCGQLQLPANP